MASSEYARVARMTAEVQLLGAHIENLRTQIAELRRTIEQIRTTIITIDVVTERYESLTTDLELRLRGESDG